MKRLLVLSVFLIASACIPQDGLIIANTSLKTQAMQTRDFAASKKVVFASTMSVLQDLGYTVVSADFTTGFVTAKGPTTGGFVLFMGQTQNSAKATAFIESITEGRSRVRLNFVKEEKTSSSYGMEGGSSEAVEDPTVYQKAFEKIDKAIFVRKSS
jgi:hypothetical protein